MYLVLTFDLFESYVVPFASFAFMLACDSFSELDDCGRLSVRLELFLD